MEDDRAPIHSDSLKVSRLYKGKLSPEEALTDIMGPRFESYRARWNRARSFKELPSFPIHVDYEVMSKCNYSCPMCPMSVRDLTHSGDDKLEENRGKGEKRLSSSKIKELLEEGAAKGQAALGFGGLWEPLLYKDLPEIVSYGRDLGLVDMMINTNGSLLTQNLSQDLIESGLTRLMVSLDALSPETYKQIRRGGNLEQVEENIRVFLEERKKRKSPLPLLRVSFLVTSINESELQGFMRHWEDRADFLSVQRFGLFAGVNAESLFPKGSKDQKEELSVCAQPFKRLLIRHDGQVMPCCDLSGMRMSVGDIYKESIEDIWKGEKIKRLREELKDPKTLSETCALCQAKYG